MENTKETLEKQRCIKCQMEHSVEIPLISWKYNMDGLLDSCVVLLLYGTKNSAYNSIFTFNFG